MLMQKHSKSFDRLKDSEKEQIKYIIVNEKLFY